MCFDIIFNLLRLEIFLTFKSFLDYEINVVLYQLRLLHNFECG